MTINVIIQLNNNVNTLFKKQQHLRHMKIIQII
jgi:hypothetical protein